MSSDAENRGDSAASALPTEEFLSRLFGGDGAIRFTCVSRRGGKVEKTSIHPVKIRGEALWQCEKFSEGKAYARNIDADAARRMVEDLLETNGPREAHLVSQEGDLHVRVTRKGHALVSRSKAKAPAQARGAATGDAADGADAARADASAHDHMKDQPLERFDATVYLRVLGFADGSGQIRASMRDKLKQVNEFLRAIDATLGETRRPGKFDIADCGCGRAYLTFAAQLYLTHVRGDSVRIRGIDHNAGIIAECNRMARDLGLSEDEAKFVAGDIAKVQLDLEPNILLSLHACDTATDEAIARGVEWKAQYILSAPCCQHELQEQLGTGGSGPLRAVLRHGILRERVADIFTDAFRAQVLRIQGYRVKVVEFVEPSATARNILLRAERTAKPGLSTAIEEYKALAEFLGTKPYIARRLPQWLE